MLNNGFVKWCETGLPLSPYLFILSAEILAHKIRHDPSSKGIKIFGNEVKLSLFADDTNIFCADLASMDRALKLVVLRRVWQDSRSVFKCQENEGDFVRKMGK